MPTDYKIKLLIATNIVTAIVAVIALIIALQVRSNTLNIAYVDNSRVLSEYNGIKEGTTLYKEKIGQWEANLDTLAADVDRDIKQFQADYEGMSAKERELTERLIKGKQESYFKYKEAIEDKSEEEDEKLTAAILNRMDSYLLEFGESHEYNFIIGITDAGNLLYARQGADITEQIITGLNNNYAGN